MDISLFCPYGTLENLNDYGLASNETKCPKDSYTDLILDSDCNSQAMSKEYID